MERDRSGPIRARRALHSFRAATAPLGCVARATQLRVLEPDRERSPASGLYHAHIGVHRGTQRPLSVWLLRPSLTPTPVDANQFVDDVLRASAFRHPNIERAVDVGEHEAGMYVAWLRAPSVLSDAPYYRAPLQRATIPALISGAAAGLAAAHRELLVHGCLAPTDICARNGAASVLGIGVWRFRHRALRRVFTADAAASIAPEVLSHGVASPAADVFSVAAIAAHLVFRLDIAQPVTALRSYLATHHPKLRVMFAALADEPQRRPSTPVEIAAELAENWPRWA